MDLAPDFDEFIGSLIAHRAEFLIVGAYALAFHGVPRFTGDIDFFVRPTIENAERVLAAVGSGGRMSRSIRAIGPGAGEVTLAAVAGRRTCLK